MCSHYEVYAVQTEEVPNTANIPSEDEDNSYIAFAGQANPNQLIPVTIGTGVGGQVSVENNLVTEYDNRHIVLGQSYFFFVRLYSRVVSEWQCMWQCSFLHSNTYIHTIGWKWGLSFCLSFYFLNNLFAWYAMNTNLISYT